MKKILFVMVIACFAISAVSAQNWSNSKVITIEGTLQLQNGQIAVSSGNTVYLVPELGRYVGFIDSLKEGARISVAGYASGNYIQPAQITINGKSYDLQAYSLGNYGTGYANYNNYGPCCGGYGSGRGMNWGRSW
jgi:opacity protein-like surface antigen